VAGLSVFGGSLSTQDFVKLRSASFLGLFRRQFGSWCGLAATKPSRILADIFLCNRLGGKEVGLRSGQVINGQGN
jgi:hypothetical protein